MRDLLTEGRALMLDWKNKKNPDGTYDVKFDEGPPYYGREFKGVKWRTVAGHRVLVTKKGSVVGVPDAVSKDMTGDPDKPLSTSGKTPEDAPKDKPKDDLLGGMDPEKVAENEKVEKDALDKVERLKPGEALDHLETLQEMPVTSESAKGGGLFGFIGKLVGGFVKGLGAVLKKTGGLLKKAGAKGWDYATMGKEARAALRDQKNAEKELARAESLYASHQEALNKQLTKKYRASEAQRKAQETRDRAAAALAKAKSQRIRLEKLMGKAPEKAPAKPEEKAEKPKKERRPWTSAGKMQRELERLKDPREAERDRKLAANAARVRAKQEKEAAAQAKKREKMQAILDRMKKRSGEAAARIGSMAASPA